MSPMTVLMYGPIPSCFVWMSRVSLPRLLAFRLIISAQPVSCGETRSIAGIDWLTPDTGGGSIAFEHRSHPSISYGSTILEVLKPTGRSPLAHPTLSMEGGSKVLAPGSFRPCRLN